MNKNKKVVFITGTPGVGKTSVADYLNEELNKKYNSKIFRINEIAIENDLIQGKDSERGYQIVDIDKLNKKLFEIINYDNFEDLNKNNNIAENTDSFDDFNQNIENENNGLNIGFNDNGNVVSDDLKIVIVEGHLSHLCDHCDKIVVLRLKPKFLEKRLEKRNYSESKIRENLEAESLAVCSVEAFQMHGDIVNEIDTTGLSIEEVVVNIEQVIFGARDFPVGKIDFMDWLIT